MTWIDETYEYDISHISEMLTKSVFFSLFILALNTVLLHKKEFVCSLRRKQPHQLNKEKEYY
jgi:hypothetical protein